MTIEEKWDTLIEIVSQNEVIQYGLALEAKEGSRADIAHMSAFEAFKSIRESMESMNNFEEEDE